jgi:hypothetical protein
MKDFNFKVKTGSGKYNKLDKLYQKYLLNNVNLLDSDMFHRFEIYDVIMNELIKIGDMVSFDEVKYRLTDGEDPNFVMLDIVNRYEDENGMIWVLGREIKNFIDEDTYSKFYN